MVKIRDTASMEDAREEQGSFALSNAEEEKIFVSIRVRPLNEKEKTRHDASDWECVSANTIKFRNSGHAEQRQMSMDTYTYGEKLEDATSGMSIVYTNINWVHLNRYILWIFDFFFHDLFSQFSRYL